MLPGRPVVLHCLQGRACAVWAVVIKGWNSGRHEEMDPAGLRRKFCCQFIDAIVQMGREGRLRFVLIYSDRLFTHTANSLVT